MRPILKLLLGGSPCTFWSIAKTRNRETEATGIGWELFQNYLIAREKYRPDYYLYENNKSMAKAIREQITKELGVKPILINSALVSAQNRQRLYWTNIPGVTQPDDLGILLRDVLDSGMAWQRKSYCVTATENKGVTLVHNLTHHIRTLVAEEPAGFGLRQVGRRINENGHRDDHNACLPCIQRFEVNENPQKSNCLTSVLKDSMVALPVNGAMCVAQRGRYTREDGGVEQHYEVQANGKTNTLTTVQKNNLVAQPVPDDMKKQEMSVSVYDDNYQFATGGNRGHNEVLSSHFARMVIEATDGKAYPVYKVLGGKITIRGKEFPIKLPDGLYMIRKLTVSECKRLQTVPEDYIFPVSNAQAYKMLGNGWTVKVISHILSFCPGIRTEPVEVLSMYDGMSCGRIALKELGAKIIRYYATETDKYAIQTSLANYPEIIQLGDAFQVRDIAWALPRGS